MSMQRASSFQNDEFETQYIIFDFDLNLYDFIVRGGLDGQNLYFCLRRVRSYLYVELI